MVSSQQLTRLGDTFESVGGTLLSRRVQIPLCLLTKFTTTLHRSSQLLPQTEGKTDPCSPLSVLQHSAPERPRSRTTDSKRPSHTARAEVTQHSPGLPHSRWDVIWTKPAIDPVPPGQVCSCLPSLTPAADHSPVPSPSAPGSAQPRAEMCVG